MTSFLILVGIRSDPSCRPHFASTYSATTFFLARLKGVEPLSEVLEAPILPLNYRRICWWSFSYHLEDTLCSQAVRRGFHLLCLYSKTYPLLGSEGGTRTHDPMINSHMLLPTELPRNILAIPAEFEPATSSVTG